MSGDFRPYDPFAPHLIRRRRLPHWDQPGATIFVTFRLDDSLPREVIDRLAEIQRHYPHNSEVTQEWIDAKLDAGFGAYELAVSENSNVVAKVLWDFGGMRYTLGRFVIMPNHVHALVQPRPPWSLEQVLHGWKSYSAHCLRPVISRRGPLWQRESYDHIVRSENELRILDQYVMRNPEVARLRSGSFVVGHGSARWRDSTLSPIPGTQAQRPAPRRNGQTHPRFATAMAWK